MRNAAFLPKARRRRAAALLFRWSAPKFNQQEAL